jgi:hypothetical protein
MPRPGRALHAKSATQSAAWRELAKRYEAWDFAQADSHDRDKEPDEARLGEALALRGTNAGQSLALVRSLADAGSPRAADAMGEAYLSGRGVAANRTAAQHWFKQAFERGSLRGMLHYGWLLFFVGRRLDEAEAVFATGVRDGWAPALYWTARIQAARSGSKALPLIRPLLERATAAGSPAARAMLMGLMISGRYGLWSIPKGFAMAMAATTERQEDIKLMMSTVGRGFYLTVTYLTQLLSVAYLVAAALMLYELVRAFLLASSGKAGAGLAVAITVAAWAVACLAGGAVWVVGRSMDRRLTKSTRNAPQWLRDRLWRVRRPRPFYRPWAKRPRAPADQI